MGKESFSASVSFGNPQEHPCLGFVGISVLATTNQAVRNDSPEPTAEESSKACR